jgi:hypothetical protein
MNRHSLAIAGMALLSPVPLLAQKFEASLAAQMMTYRSHSGGPVLEQGGTFQGGAAGVWFGNVRVRLEGLIGNVRPAADRAFTLRTTTLSAGLRSGAVEFGFEAVARHRSTSDQTTSLARLAGPYGTVISEFGRGFSGSATLAWYLVRRTVNADPLSVAVKGDIGAQFAPGGSTLSFFTSYRVLRLDYRALGAGTARLEQDAGALFGVTWRPR